MNKALIVGINYPGTSSALRGCVNDANIMNKMLRDHFGFTNISMLLDAQATTANILAQLNKLVAGAVPGDTLFFHYSGHGSQVVDRNGDEADGLDEIICPVDLNWRDKIIKDDDLKAIFDKVPTGVNLTVCLDCCNSGGALDQANQYQPVVTDREMAETELAEGRFLPPPAFAIEGAEEAKVGFKPKLIQSRNVNQTGLLFTGCQSHQTSADAFINGKYQGAFTYALTKVLADNNYRIEHIQLIEKINQYMVAAGFTQRPELNGSPSLFDMDFLRDRNYDAPLLPAISIQQPVEAPKENKKNNNLLIIGGIVALAALAAFMFL